MSRRNNTTDPAVTSGGGSAGTVGGSSRTSNGRRTDSLDGSPRQKSTAIKENEEQLMSGNNGGNVQFLAIRSRVGKRYQAQLPDLQVKSIESLHKKAKVMHIAKQRYSLDRANALGPELDKYLKLARSLRDGATFDTEEQVSALALEYLHRFDYNPTDAACSLYAKHSMEIPKIASVNTDVSSSRNVNGVDVQLRWLSSFYRMMRLPSLGMSDYLEMADQHAKAMALGMEMTEVGVLGRLVTRLSKWLTACKQAKSKQMERADLQQLVYEAEDLALVMDEIQVLQHRIHAFDIAYGRLKDAIHQTSRRKCLLSELEHLFQTVSDLKISFPEYDEYFSILKQARELEQTISIMLREEKVSITTMRDVLSKLEMVPVNFEKEVELFQQKMLNAQTWLAKVRKCIPKRRTSRRGPGVENKKMDLESIRALVIDAPCDDSAEVFEMQDLLECADEWADKVKHAIEGGADVTLEQLKELMEEGNEMPVDMDEQKYLEAEIDAREWSSQATIMLKSCQSLEELEHMMERAKIIRKQLHPKKQTRWKPQIERDIQAALELARRWVHEVKDVFGSSIFEKLGSSSSLENLLTGDLSTNPFKGKKTMESIDKLLKKVDRLEVNVTMYVKYLHELVSLTEKAQQDAINILSQIGVGTEKREEGGDFAHACMVLDRIASLPLIFDQALELYEIVQMEKDWMGRVREALPPRQSRKKRTMKHSITLEYIVGLLEESKTLRFEFPEEIKILNKELEEVAIWQAKAREMMESSHLIQEIAVSIKEYDLAVYQRITQAKEKHPLDTMIDKQEMDKDVVEQASEPLEESSIQEKPISSISQQVDAILQREANIEATRQSMPAWIEPPVVFDSICVQEILTTIRKEAGCVKKASEVKKIIPKESNVVTSLDSLLTLVETSITAVNGIEVKEHKKQNLSEEDMSLGDAPDQAVKQLETFSEQVAHVLEEGGLFNAIAPEVDILSTVVDLFEWLQAARSIFYDEILPLKQLVTKGKDLQEALSTMQDKSSLSTTTINLLLSLLWPLPYLLAHEALVMDWTQRVTQSLQDKHAPLVRIQSLLTEAALELLLEPEAYKCILDEIKKAKLWLAKLKKRIKSLVTKNITRFVPSVARSLVEEGREIALELPAWTILEQQVSFATQWEQRVVASGLQTGQAQLGELLELLHEYEQAHLMIDLDSHRDVLQSATERYCICRQPYDGFMIGCDLCEDWFHDTCIGMSKEKAEKVEQYTCPSCLLFSGLQLALERAQQEQEQLWKDTEYIKTYEKQNGAAQRKVKREEKAIERSEMLLFSCNNHMNQLRTRIEDIERAKACLTLKQPFEANTPSTTSQPPLAAATAAVTATAAAIARAAAIVNVSTSTTSTNTTTTTSTTNPSIDTMSFVQRYPNILLSTKFPPIQNDTTSSGTTGQSTPVSTGTSPVPTATTPSTSTMQNNMLAPMLAKLSENTERLSALLVAGGVEQQLTKMKTEHAEVKAQVQELHEAIRVSKERFVNAQTGLDELKRAFLLRQHGIPRAKAWVQRVIMTLNNPDSLRRAKFVQSEGYMSTEFVELLLDARAKEIAHLAEVKSYLLLLRLVGWTLAVVSMLQERPSREAIVDAITYAGAHDLGEFRDTVSPLRAIVGRIDAWILKAQKCLSRQPSTVAQKLVRLKILMNEYTKLPLTCSWIGTVEDYIKVAEMESSNESTNKITPSELAAAQADAEAVALAAANAALAQGTPSTVSKAPRKRKSITKKEKISGVETSTNKNGCGTPEPGDKKSKKAKFTQSSTDQDVFMNTATDLNVVANENVDDIKSETPYKMEENKMNGPNSKIQVVTQTATGSE